MISAVAGGLLALTVSLPARAARPAAARAHPAAHKRSAGSKRPAAQDRSLTGRDCPALFGSGATRSRNRRWRARRLSWVHEDEAGVTVVHTGSWRRRPGRVRLRGMRLLSAVPAKGGGGGGGATIRLAGWLARRVGCRRGPYHLGRDDALDADTRVLAVLRGKLLVARRGELRYVATRAVGRPRWLLAWGSRYGLIPQR